MQTKKQKQAESEPTGTIAIGRYRTRERFVVSKPDKRLRDGLFSRGGIDAGVMVWVRKTPERALRFGGGDGTQIEMCMPWASGMTPFAYGLEDGSSWWGAPSNETGMGASDWSRFLANLERDDSTEAWLDATLGASRSMRAGYDDVLLELLDGGYVSRALVERAHARVDARREGGRVPEWPPSKQIAVVLRAEVERAALAWLNAGIYRHETSGGLLDAAYALHERLTGEKPQQARDRWARERAAERETY